MLYVLSTIYMFAFYLNKTLLQKNFKYISLTLTRYQHCFSNHRVALKKKMDFSKYGFKKFDGFRDFAFWKSKVRNHLRFLGLEVHIESEPVNNSTTNKPEPADWAKNNQANAFIRECLCDSLYQRYDLKSAKELWDKLKADYEKKDAQQCFILLRKFNNCVKEKKETMMDFISTEVTKERARRG